MRLQKYNLAGKITLLVFAVAAAAMLLCIGFTRGSESRQERTAQTVTARKVKTPPEQQPVRVYVPDSTFNYLVAVETA